MEQRMKDIFCRQIDTELERISKLPSLDNNTLNQLNLLTDTKKNILKIEKLEMENEVMRGGNSFRGNSYDYIRGEWGNSMNGNSYAQGNNQYTGNSNAIRMPMYGNSGTDAYSHLEAAMRDASNDQEREEIRRLMTKYYN